MTSTSILLVDDHQMFRDGLRAFLEQQSRFEIVGAVGTIDEAIETLRRHQAIGTPVRFILLDIALGETSSISKIPRLRSTVPESAIVMLSMHASTTLVRTALDAGASGYVTKTSAGPEIIAALDAISNGRCYVDRSLKYEIDRSMTADRSPSAFERYRRLSPREQQVFLDLARGNRPRQIAQKHGIAIRTADAHRYHILQKLEMRNVAELVRMAVELGVIEESSEPG